MKEPLLASAAFLDLVFPFYFGFDETLCLVGIGPSLRKICPDLTLGDPLNQHFRLLRPPIAALSAETLKGNLKQVFLFKIEAMTIELKGQIVYLPTEGFFFLGSPAVKKVSELIRAKITLNDFALHDNTTESLLMMQLYQQQMDLQLAEKNRELEFQQHEVASQNEELRQQKEEIEAINDGLEHTVAIRTEELSKIIEELSAQNQNLEQFSYIISHNLRSPLAQILGLLSIFDRQEPGNLFNEKVLQHLDKSADNLNMVITDLSAILAVQRNWDKAKEIIQLKHIIGAVLDSLQVEIEQSQARISFELGNTEVICTIRAYLHSILFNLIGNALKYRSPDRAPRIRVTATTDEAFVVISVADNGLGIDLTKFAPDQFFGLYKRLHLHIEGKGLGLYLVKTQVETLNGKIEVASQPDQSTVFTVYLPKE